MFPFSSRLFCDAMYRVGAPWEAQPLARERFA